jgi:hypothetical protein
VKKFVVGAALAFVALVALAGVSGAQVNPPIVDIELTPDETAYWLVDSQGAVTYVGAPFHGDRPPLHWGETVVSMSSTPDGGGYWLFTTLGRAIPYGNADHLGDMAGVQLARPVIDSIATPSGDGYYMVAEDGGIFTFGDARFRGSMGGRHLNRPVNGLAPTASGNGYWLVADDGGIFSFGDARFHGSMGGRHLNRPVVGMIGQGEGYLLLGADGGIFNFGSSRFHGSLGGAPPRSEITAVTVKQDLSGYTMVTQAGTVHPFGAMPTTGWAGYPEPGVGSALPSAHMVVGVHIQPGTYRLYSKGSESCAWNRYGATQADYRGSEAASGPMVMTIRPGDGIVTMWSAGCWLAVGDLSPLQRHPEAAFGPGSYMVHRDVRPGTWRSAVTAGGCEAMTLKSFDGSFGAPDERWNLFGPGQVTVTIDSNDLGFYASDGCGTWTRIG